MKWIVSRLGLKYKVSVTEENINDSKEGSKVAFHHLCTAACVYVAQNFPDYLPIWVVQACNRV